MRELVDWHVWLPRLEALRPEMVFVSAGFDAHREDDLGQMRLWWKHDYAWITQQLKDVGQAPLPRGASFPAWKAATT